MKRASAGILASLFLGFVVAVTAYFLSNPQYRRTEKDAEIFYEAALPGAPFSEALRASRPFSSITLGACGGLAVSHDTVKRGVVFSPPVGAFERFSGVTEFFAKYPRLFADRPECRKVTVVFMNGYVDKGRVELEVDERGVIRSRREPVIFN
jgi:hypothetical protein